MKVKSPCKNICRYENDKCIGCYRTIEEIANWILYSDGEKRKILDNIEKRKKDDGMNYYGFP